VTATIQYRPFLDGLRAIAVVAVILYHLDLAAVPGGFLGVDVFFVLSGYLITSLLLAEREVRGRIDFTGFYARRARRLLPALFLMFGNTRSSSRGGAPLVPPLVAQSRWSSTSGSPLWPRTRSPMRAS